MTHFLIQTIEGQVEHDFAFQLIKAIKSQNWFYNETLYTYTLSEGVEGYPDSIPIGSLEFVFDYLESYYNVNREQIKPLNIPSLLQKEEFLGRKVSYLQKNVIPNGDYLFVKSNSQYKKVTDVIKDTDSLPEDEYLVSELLDIDSEWRAFVQNGQLVGIKQYLGDFEVFPDIEAVKRMIHVYEDAPLSYTLDIGMVQEKCVIIEVHPFVSCGLYGFHEYKLLPIMMIQGFSYMKKEALKQTIV
jgi:ATP-grasp domain, R2K clade family 2